MKNIHSELKIMFNFDYSDFNKWLESYEGIWINNQLDLSRLNLADLKLFGRQLSENFLFNYYRLDFQRSLIRTLFYIWTEIESRANESQKL